MRLLAALLAFALVLGVAFGITCQYNITSLPVNITKSGVYCLQNNIVYKGKVAPPINVSSGLNVIIYGNGHYIEWNLTTSQLTIEFLRAPSSNVTLENITLIFHVYYNSSTGELAQILPDVAADNLTLKHAKTENAILYASKNLVFENSIANTTSFITYRGLLINDSEIILSSSLYAPYTDIELRTAPIYAEILNTKFNLDKKGIQIIFEYEGSQLNTTMLNLTIKNCVFSGETVLGVPAFVQIDLGYFPSYHYYNYTYVYLYNDTFNTSTLDIWGFYKVVLKNVELSNELYLGAYIFGTSVEYPYTIYNLTLDNVIDPRGAIVYGHYVYIYNSSINDSSIALSVHPLNYGYIYNTVMCRESNYSVYATSSQPATLFIEDSVLDNYTAKNVTVQLLNDKTCSGEPLPNTTKQLCQYYITKLPYTINTPGVYCVVHNVTINTSKSANCAITVNTTGVTLNFMNTYPKNMTYFDCLVQINKNASVVLENLTYIPTRQLTKEFFLLEPVLEITSNKLIAVVKNVKILCNNTICPDVALSSNILGAFKIDVENVTMEVSALHYAGPIITAPSLTLKNVTLKFESYISTIGGSVGVYAFTLNAHNVYVDCEDHDGTGIFYTNGNITNTTVINCWMGVDAGGFATNQTIIDSKICHNRLDIVHVYSNVPILVEDSYFDNIYAVYLSVIPKIEAKVVNSYWCNGTPHTAADIEIVHACPKYINASDIPCIINSSGTYYITQNISAFSYSYRPMIYIAASNVVLDCRGHALVGSSYIDSEDHPNLYFGIYLQHGVKNVIIKNCYIGKLPTLGVVDSGSTNVKLVNDTITQIYNNPNTYIYVPFVPHAAIIYSYYICYQDALDLINTSVLDNTGSGIWYECTNAQGNITIYRSKICYNLEDLQLPFNLKIFNITYTYFDSITYPNDVFDFYDHNRWCNGDPKACILIYSLPYTINKSGLYCFAENLSPTGTITITGNATNVTICGCGKWLTGEGTLNIWVNTSLKRLVIANITLNQSNILVSGYNITSSASIAVPRKVTELIFKNISSIPANLTTVGNSLLVQDIIGNIIVDNVTVTNVQIEYGTINGSVSIINSSLGKLDVDVNGNVTIENTSVTPSAGVILYSSPETWIEATTVKLVHFRQLGGPFTVYGNTVSILDSNISTSTAILTAPVLATISANTVILYNDTILTTYKYATASLAVTANNLSVNDSFIMGIVVKNANAKFYNDSLCYSPNGYDLNASNAVAYVFDSHLDNWTGNVTLKNVLPCLSYVKIHNSFNTTAVCYISGINATKKIEFSVPGGSSYTISFYPPFVLICKVGQFTFIMPVNVSSTGISFDLLPYVIPGTSVYYPPTLRICTHNAVATFNGTQIKNECKSFKIELYKNYTINYSFIYTIHRIVVYGANYTITNSSIIVKPYTSTLVDIWSMPPGYWICAQGIGEIYINGKPVVLSNNCTRVAPGDYNIYIPETYGNNVFLGASWLNGTKYTAIWLQHNITLHLPANKSAVALVAYFSTFYIRLSVKGLGYLDGAYCIRQLNKTVCHFVGFYVTHSVNYTYSYGAYPPYHVVGVFYYAMPEYCRSLMKLNYSNGTARIELDIPTSGPGLVDVCTYYNVYLLTEVPQPFIGANGSVYYAVMDVNGKYELCAYIFAVLFKMNMTNPIKEVYALHCFELNNSMYTIRYDFRPLTENKSYIIANVYYLINNTLIEKNVTIPLNLTVLKITAPSLKDAYVAVPGIHWEKAYIVHIGFKLPENPVIYLYYGANVFKASYVKQFELLGLKLPLLYEPRLDTVYPLLMQPTFFAENHTAELRVFPVFITKHDLARTLEVLLDYVDKEFIDAVPAQELLTGKIDSWTNGKPTVINVAYLYPEQHIIPELVLTIYLLTDEGQLEKYVCVYKDVNLSTPLYINLDTDTHCHDQVLSYTDLRSQLGLETGIVHVVLETTTGKPISGEILIDGYKYYGTEAAAPVLGSVSVSVPQTIDGYKFVKYSTGATTPTVVLDVHPGVYTLIAYYAPTSKKLPTVIMRKPILYLLGYILLLIGILLIIVGLILERYAKHH